MPDTSPGLGSLLADAIRSAMIDVHTALPARVESYDAATQTADIKPMLKRVMRRANMERVTETLPVIPCVPVMWPRGGGYFMHMPLTPGDSGMLIFSEYQLDRWRSTGDDVDPGDTRRHDLSGAVFIPGLFPSGEAIGDAAVEDGDNGLRLGNDGNYVVMITDDSIRIPDYATQFLARADRVATELNAIKNSFDAHTHVTTATDNTGALGVIAPPSSPMPTPGDTSSDTVRGV